MAIGTIIVPLDGSELAETALSMARPIALHWRARVTLLHVLERQPPAQIHGQRHLADAASAADYLQGVARRLAASGLGNVDVHVHDNAVRDVARSLSEHAAEFAADLIVMTAHGRGGVTRWVYGSIAQQAAVQSQRPLLFVSCPKAPLPGGVVEVRNVLVPLDGDPSHEAVLPLARDLAESFGAAVRLLSVVPTLTQVSGARGAVARSMPRALAAELELEAESAGQYLRSVRAAHPELLRSPNQPSLDAPDLVERGDPAKAILHAAQRLAPAMVVTATHRKIGTTAFWAGSVAPRVAASAQCPLAMLPLATRA